MYHGVFSLIPSLKYLWPCIIDTFKVLTKLTKLKSSQRIYYLNKDFEQKLPGFFQVSFYEHNFYNICCPYDILSLCQVMLMIASHKLHRFVSGLLQ